MQSYKAVVKNDLFGLFGVQEWNSAGIKAPPPEVFTVTVHRLSGAAPWAAGWMARPRTENVSGKVCTGLALPGET